MINQEDTSVMKFRVSENVVCECGFTMTANSDFTMQCQNKHCRHFSIVWKGRSVELESVPAKAKQG